MRERRKFSRRHLYLYFDTFDIEGNFIGKLVDISLKGVKLITVKEINENCSTKLNIKFPCSFNIKNLIINAKNIWCKRNSEDTFLSGYVLEDVSLETVKTIKEVF